MKRQKTEVLIIGGGPAGYVCGVRCGQLGLRTVVVEADALGGTCLNVGCIPSKALIHAAEQVQKVLDLSKGPLGISADLKTIDFRQTIAWKDGIVRKLTSGVGGLLKKAGVTVVHGKARILDGKTVEIAGGAETIVIETEHLVLATGSRAVELPDLPFGGSVISSTDALQLAEIPETFAVVGGGYIGLEIGTAMAKLGSKVTVVEAAGRILPQYDAELTRPVAARLSQLEVMVHTGAKAKGMSADGKSLLFVTEDGEQTVAAAKVLVTIGRKPVLDGFGLEQLGLDMQGRYIRIDGRCATSMRGVYAIGDITGEPMLAHRAMAQGNLVAETIAGGQARWDKRAIPAVCFTDPEVVTVGLLPSDRTDAKVSIFPFLGNGRSMTLERSDGFVRFVSDPNNDLILGIQAVGAGVAELAGQFSLAVEMGATLLDVAETIHAHPTLGETTQEAALKGLGRALHI